MLQKVAPYTARQFSRAVVMPNLAPPVTNVDAARDYRKRILETTAPGFTPLMTCYLTDNSSPDEIARGHSEGVWIAAKLYPAGATTNSASGVTDIRNISPVLARMEKIGMVLCVHAEVTDPDVDVFDREAVFIDRVLTRVVSDFPELKIVLEHITTADAVDFVATGRVGATITPQHLIINRNALFAGGLRPHAYCLPLPKREEHRLAVRRAAVSGWPNVFLGTDSAPHARDAKESACGCARRKDDGDGRLAHAGNRQCRGSAAKSFTRLSRSPCRRPRRRRAARRCLSQADLRRGQAAASSIRGEKPARHRDRTSERQAATR